jgi:glycine cleavage system H protein
MTAVAPQPEEVAGFPLRVDLSYDPGAHMWVEPSGPGRARVGLDPLEVEASGTIAAVDLVAPGTRVERGEPIGSLEAEKFVGPLVSPVSGVVVAANAGVLAAPSAVDADPYAAWLVEVETAGDLEAELVHGAEAVREWFVAAVADYRLRGVLAE